MSDPSDPCFCTDIPRSEPAPYAWAGPPEYSIETEPQEGPPSLYSPEAVRPSHGASPPGGPVVISR